jgi:flagellar protein FliL
MSHPETPADDPPEKRSKRPLLIGGVLMLALGGAGFGAVQSGLLFGHAGTDGTHAEPDAAEALPDIAFVPLEPLIVSMAGDGGTRHLRVTAQLEVPKAHEEEVRLLTPRVLDVMNSYLRALDVAELEDPTALVRLRAQIARRVQLVAGDGRVRDVLLTEFVIN